MQITADADHPHLSSLQELDDPSSADYSMGLSTSFNKYCVPGIVLGTGDPAVDKTDQKPTVMDLSFWEGR